MAYNATLDAVYNHYLTAYAPKSTSSQYDTHKKSELRNIYNSIVKLNKEAPLYLFDSSKESREFAVGLKENARELRNTIASLGGLDETEMFNKKAAFSSNEDMVSASYIGEASGNGPVPSFKIEVTALASNQVNMGNFIPSDAPVGMPADTYSFDIAINDLSYEFQFNIHEGETNRELQERLSRLVSNADIGLKADILEDGQGNSSLRLTSEASGLKEGRDLIFQVSDDKTSKRAGAVDYLGLDYISRTPSNAEFILNGEARSASSNHFTVDKAFELTLNGVSPVAGQTARVGLKTDSDSLVENIGNLVGGYNDFIRSASEYLDAHPRSSRLLGEMNHIARTYQFELEKMGMTFENNGQITLDSDQLRDSLGYGDTHEQLSAIRDFTNSVLNKTNQVSINPMEYVDKTIVAYKNPGHNFVSPYVTSNYSGMLFNSYC